MARFKKIPLKKNEGKVVYGDGIVDGIVLLAMSEVSYAELYTKKPHAKNKSNSIKVVFDKDGVHIDVSVKIHFSQCVSDMAFKIQETIRHNVESMTEYHVAGVNVIVCGVLFEDKQIEVQTENNEQITNEKLADKKQTNNEETISSIKNTTEDDKPSKKDDK